MATAAERKAAKAGDGETVPEAEEPRNAPSHYTAKRDLFISGVPAFRSGDQVPAGHVARYGWGHDVEDPGEDEKG